MKRFLFGVVLFTLIVSSIGIVSDAQRRRRPRQPGSDGKTDVPCPRTLNDIRNCMRLRPDTGCGHLDVNLIPQKNIQESEQSAKPKELQDLKNLPDPIPGFKVGDPRESLRSIGEGGFGEGKKVTVIAYALVARSGS